jgi:hypothetical protein
MNNGNQVLDGSFTEMRELTENEIVQVCGGTSHQPPQDSNKPPQHTVQLIGVDSGGGGATGDH